MNVLSLDYPMTGEELVDFLTQLLAERAPAGAAQWELMTLNAALKIAKEALEREVTLSRLKDGTY